MKAAQLGLTSKAMLRVAYRARYGGYRGILYLFPSKSDVTDFAKGRIDPLIDDNPDTIGQWVRDTDSASVKRIWNCFLYLRGMKARVGLKSVPADFIVFDELDEAPQNAIDMAMERMGHSEFREVLNARAFAERHSGRVFLNYYNEHQKGSYAWDEKKLIVSCNRTESLDASHRKIMEQTIILPKECEMTKTFANHLHNVAKKLEEDEETGSKRYVYVKLGPDHFRHAFNYEVMARGILARTLFPEFDDQNIVS